MSILSEIGAWLLGIGAATLNFLKGAALSLEANPQLLEFATTAVKNAENMAVTSLEKQAAAKSEILGQLASVGLPVIFSQVNLAIESALANLKLDQDSSSEQEPVAE